MPTFELEQRTRKGMRGAKRGMPAWARGAVVKAFYQGSYDDTHC